MCLIAILDCFLLKFMEYIWPAKYIDKAVNLTAKITKIDIIDGDLKK